MQISGESRAFEKSFKIHHQQRKSFALPLDINCDDRPFKIQPNSVTKE